MDEILTQGERGCKVEEIRENKTISEKTSKESGT